MRIFLSRALKRRGFEVQAVERGEEALAAWEARRFDLGLLDLKMPGIDGLETIARLRELDPEATLVMMTATGPSRRR